MKSLRVLIVAHDHRVWTDGGVEHFTADLGEALDARSEVESRILVAATSLQRGPTSELERIDGALVTWVGAYDRLMMSRPGGAEWARNLANEVAAFAPDVVHFHGLDRLGVEAIAVAQRAAPHARLVMTLHDWQPLCANDGLLLTTRDGVRCRGPRPDACRACFPQISAERFALRERLIKTHFGMIDLFLAPSRFALETYAAWGLPRDKLRVLGNAAPKLDASGDGAAEGPPRRFGFFGNALPHKGVFTLLDAAKRLAMRGAEVSIGIYGGLGRLPRDARAHFAAALESAWPVATHLGPYDRAQAVRLMRGVDWVLVPSVWPENAPLVALEAAAAGRPVIASAVGGLPEIVQDGRNGLLTPPGDPAALADAILRASEDRALWSRFVAEIRSPRDMDACAADHVEAYRALFDRRAA